MGRQGKYKRKSAAEKELLDVSSTDLVDKMFLVIFVVCTALVPLVIRLHQVNLDQITATAYKGNGSYIDVFSHWKTQLLILSFAVMGFLWLFRLVQKRKMQLQPVFIPLGIHALFVILSALFSPYNWVVLHGYPDRLEGVFVLLAYVLLAFSTSVVVRTEKARKFVIIFAMVSSVLLAVLGASQYLGKDFLQTVTGKSLYIPDAYSALFDKLNFNFGKNYMYVTVYNPNYLGSLSALLLPIAIMLTFYWLEKKSLLSLTGFLFIGSTFILWLGGMSRAGLAGGTVAILFLLVFGIRDVLRHWKGTVLIVLLCSTLFSGMDRFSDGAVTREFRRTLPAAIEAKLPKPTVKASFHPFVLRAFAETTTKEEVSTVVPTNAATPTPTPTPKPAPAKKPLVLETTLENNHFHFVTETEALTVVLEGGSLMVFDDDNHELEYTIKQTEDKSGEMISTVAFEDDQYKRYSMQLVSGGALLKWWGHTIPLIVVDDQLTVNTKKGVYESHIEAAEVFDIGDNEDYASNRGYIWSRSIPLLKNHIILGAGPDAYAMVFPQTDIAGKINWLSNHNMLVDKPHNWYLQVAINTGMISLLALLTFLGWYLLCGIRLKNEPSLGEGRLIHIGIMSGVVGYCVAGMANDSNVSVAPVFWVMLGLGLSYVLSAQQARTVRLAEGAKTSNGNTSDGKKTGVNQLTTTKEEIATQNKLSTKEKASTKEKTSTRGKTSTNKSSPKK